MTEYQEQKSSVLAALREIAELAQQSGAETLAIKLRSDRIPRLENDRFHLVVLGEFNHGKTTFVNALLGRAVLPVGVMPTTAVIHRIRFGEPASASAQYSDGTERAISVDDLKQFEVGGKQDSSVQHIDLLYPAPVLREGLVLVDTPGVNDLNEARAEITYDYIPRSDAIVFLLDAGQILKESERSFVSGKLLSASKNKVLFVVNKVDLLSDEEQKEALAYARKHLEELVPDPKVYALSAQRALEGKPSGIDTFVDELQSFLKLQRGRMLLENALDVGLRATHHLTSGVQIQRRALEMEQSELERRLNSLGENLRASEERYAQRSQQIRESLAGLKGKVRSNVERFGDQFAEALPAEIDQSGSADLRKYLAGFIEERFRGFAEEQADEVAVRLEQVAEETIAFVTDDTQVQTQRLRDVFGDDTPRLELDVNTFAYDVGVFAVGAFGITMMMLSNVVVGGALTVAAPVLAYLFRGRADKLVRARAKEEAPQIVREAAASMASAFERRIDEFGEELIRFVSTAGEEMTRNIVELVRAAQAAQAQGDDARRKLESSVSISIARLSELQGRMESLKTTL